jgi:hypothetical protein
MSPAPDLLAKIAAFHGKGWPIRTTGIGRDAADVKQPASIFGTGWRDRDVTDLNQTASL